MPIVSGGGGGLLSATKTLTDSQIQALITTRVTVIAAPGAGRIIIPLSAVLVPSLTGGAYGDFSQSTLFLGTATDEINLLDVVNAAGLGNLLTGGNLMQLVTTQQSAAAATLGFSSGSGPSVFRNEPLVIGVYGALTPFSGGGAANTLTVVVNYVTISA